MSSTKISLSWMHDDNVATTFAVTMIRLLKVPCSSHYTHHFVLEDKNRGDALRSDFAILPEHRECTIATSSILM